MTFSHLKSFTLQHRPSFGRLVARLVPCSGCLAAKIPTLFFPPHTQQQSGGDAKNCLVLMHVKKKGFRPERLARGWNGLRSSGVRALPRLCTAWPVPTVLRGTARCGPEPVQEETKKYLIFTF